MVNKISYKNRRLTGVRFSYERLRGPAVALTGGVIAALAVASTFVACGDDTGGGGNPDAGMDATNDQHTPETGGGGDAKEAGNDAAEAAARDADASLAPDTSEGGDATPEADALSDAPNALQQYALSYAQAFCTGNLRCCTGYPNGYDFAKCVEQQQAQGFENTLPSVPLAYTNGHLTLNQDAGTSCIAALTSVACGTTVTAAINAGMANACYGVFQGTIPVDGGGCVDNFECAEGYCNILLDGGLIVVADAGDASVTRTTGVCTALVGDGGNCTNSAQCTAVNARPASFCSALLTLDAGTCQGLLPDDAGCADPNGIFYDLACQSELCAGGASSTSCGGSFPNDSTNGFCTAYADAGGGG